jgi:Mu transposase, C-terminal
MAAWFARRAGHTSRRPARVAPPPAAGRRGTQGDGGDGTSRCRAARLRRGRAVATGLRGYGPGCFRGHRRRRRPAGIERHRAADPVLLHEAFRWSAVRVVTETATVSLAGNRYQVDPSPVGRRIEVRCDPKDLTSLTVFVEGAAAGVGHPLVIGRHTHPQCPKPPVPRPRRRRPARPNPPPARLRKPRLWAPQASTSPLWPRWAPIPLPQSRSHRKPELMLGRGHPNDAGLSALQRRNRRNPARKVSKRL